MEKGHLCEIVNVDEFAATVETKKVVLDNVVDNLHAEAKVVICEANNALVVEKDENKDDKRFVLTNVFEYANN